MTLEPQQRKWYFTKNPPSSLARLMYINKQFGEFIGNNNAKKILTIAAHHALGDKWHRCNQNFAFLGPPSTGKTKLARLFGEEILDLPFIEIQPRTIRQVNDILFAVATKLESIEMKSLFVNKKVTLQLVPDEGTNNCFTPPPCVIFIDEVHTLKNHIVHALLKATEPKDCMMETERGWKVNTENICWMIATTERGLLFDALDTRFTKINLESYSSKEVARIVKLNHPQLDDDTCLLLTKFGGRIAREVLEFTEGVIAAKGIYPNSSWEALVKEYATAHGIDEHGMTQQRVKILTALGQNGAIASNRLALIAGCKVEELKNYILPPLLVLTNDEPSMVSVCHQGYTITSRGLQELDLRGIKNLGTMAMPVTMRPGNRLFIDEPKPTCLPPDLNQDYTNN